MVLAAHQTHRTPTLSYKPLAFALLTALSVWSPTIQATGSLTGFGDGYDGDAANADGTVIVGDSNTANGTEAFRWTQAGGMVGLGDLAGGNFYSKAKDVNADGSVVVGISHSVNGYEAFRWTQAGGMVGLGGLAGGSFHSSAQSVNADGSVVVGDSNIANGVEAFRWTQAGGMVGLGDLAGGVSHSEANDVNADGSVVVGVGHSANGFEAFRWTQAGGMVGLGDLAGGDFESEASGVNADGSVVVGISSSANGDEAFRWTQTTGMISVQDWLTNAGVSLAGFSLLSHATGVSADGNTVVGSGINANGNAETYIARVDSASSGIVGLTDLGNSMAQTLAVSSQMERLNGMLLNGAHHRPLMDMAVADKNGCAWVNGDAGRVYRSANGYTGLTEVGACHDFSAQGIRVGAGLGQSFSNLTLANGGNSRIQGQYGLAEIDWQVPNQPVLLSLLGVYGKWDANLRRGYAIAGTKPSSGETDVNVYSLRARLDWQDAFHLGAVNFSPRVAYTVTRSEVDGYQEEGGSAPANFQDQNHTAKEVRVGLTGKYTLNDKTTVLGHGEFSHRFDERGASIEGNINALGFGIGLRQAGNAVRQDWVRLGAEVDYKLSDTSLINASSFISSAGQDADITAAMSYRLAF